jgi:hypothetical protein
MEQNPYESPELLDVQSSQPDWLALAAGFCCFMAFAVLGAIVGIPSALANFPGNLFLLVFPFGLCLVIPVLLHRHAKGWLGTVQVLVETAGVWAGVAGVNHAFHGFWDGQGMVVALLGFLFSAPIGVLLLISTREP